MREKMRGLEIETTLSCFDDQDLLHIRGDKTSRPPFRLGISPTSNSGVMAAYHFSDGLHAATYLNDCFRRFQHMTFVATFAILVKPSHCVFSNLRQLADIAK